MTFAPGWAISHEMKTSDVDILLCADARELDRDHWVSRWARNLKTGRLVDFGRNRPNEQDEDGASRLVDAVGECSRPAVLVGYHSGVVAIVQAADRLSRDDVIGALFVAPPDVDLHCPDSDGDGNGNGLSSAPLPFPSLLIASRNDLRCSFETASDLALAWGSHLVDAGEVGPINVNSGHGPWPEGLMRLGWFLKRL